MSPSGKRRPSRRPSSRKRAQPSPAAPVAAEAGQDLTASDFPDLPALVHYVRQGRCALFVGAGLSVGAGLPTWRQLMERIVLAAAPFAVAPKALEQLDAFAAATTRAQPDVMNPLAQRDILKLFTRVLGPVRGRELFSDQSGSIDLHDGTAYQDAIARVRRDTAIAQELSTLLAAGKFPELAGYCRDLLGRRRFHDQVRHELRLDGDIPDVHQAIVRTPYACIVTTNFDSLLEDAYARWGSRGVPKAPTGAELAQLGTLLFDDAFFILKAHGDLDDESSIIFTSEDYRRIIHSNPAFQAMLTGILLRHAVLFVGYSLSDPNFRLLLDSQLTIFNEQVPPRYALMESVGEAEREILWRTAKLRVFSYEKGQHEVVGRFLRALASRAGDPPASGASPESRPPAAAARTILARPSPARCFELAIGGSGHRIAIELREEVPGTLPRPIWSGGSQWPAWPELRHGLKAVLSRVDVELSDLSAIGAHLQRSMPDDLLRHLDQMPPETPVMLSLAPQTDTVPWEWLIVEGSPLCLRNPVVRRPTGITDKARGLRLASRPLRALVVGDAGAGNGSDVARLPGAAKEARYVAQLLRERDATVTSLEREEAVYARLVSEVMEGDYDIIHFAGHAWFERSDALLYLWDGSVSSSELASILNRRPPTLLVLNSHYTAFAPCGVVLDDRPGAETTGPPGVDRPLPPPLGFMGLASRSGVGAFVGCFGGAVRDDSAAQFSIEFYTQLLAGSRFADALYSARKATTNVNDTTGLYYSGSGYPETVLSSGSVR